MDVCELMNRCWHMDPAARPKAPEITAGLQRHLESLTTHRRISVPMTSLQQMRLKVTRNELSQDKTLQESLAVVPMDDDEIALKKLEVPRSKLSLH